MASPPDPAALTNTHIPHNPNIIEPYLQDALNTSSSSAHPAHLINPTSRTSHPINAPNAITTYPTLKLNTRNQILLFPGSFNPPHQGHLATIRYFHERRDQLAIVAMFIFADPSDIIGTKEKIWGDIILPQSLRNQMFAEVLELAQLIEGRWLHLLVGDMEGHINVLRDTTDLIADAGWDVNLVGFLGGDKLSIESPPHLPPGGLRAWGPVDEFLIMNARRPVDFYDPGPDASPHNLLGCTEWKRGKLKVEHEQSVGALWLCRALTVPGEPVIQFRASKRSASNGISSTKIRRIMSEAPDEELYGQLKDKVLSVELLLEWLKIYRKTKMMEDEGAL
ncbi:uncharacterized protein PAC_11417 [Phialocephala subalpina]|uniref:Cytidyltransferase-like domain-containing protein n=1 Tax=Phialocephala subalpina TaxID=576137 RepID=A0A1L7X924_9HELO|nr:uncharacterized protein PAC_11417 [Phialocephala subalpina]